MKALLSILAFASLAWSAAVTWTAADSANDTKWSNDANWSTASKPGATDTAIFDASGGSKAPTIDVSPTIGRLRVASTYTRAWSMAGRTLTCNHSFSDDGITTTHNYGNGITLVGLATATVSHWGTGLAANPVASNCVLTIAGKNVTLDMDETMTFKQLVLSDSAKISNNTSSGDITFSTTSPVVVLGQYAKMYNSPGDKNYFVSSSSGRIFSYATGAICSTGQLADMKFTNSTTDTVPRYGWGALYIHFVGGAGRVNVYLIDTLGYPVNPQLMQIEATVANTSFGVFFNNIICYTAYFISGTSHASATGITHYGTSRIFMTSFGSSGVNTGTYTDSMEDCRWYVSGGFYHGTTHTVVPGTSVVTFTGASATRITSSNKAFFDVIDSATVGAKDSLQDSMTCHDLTVKQGKWNFNGQNINISGNFTWANTVVDTIFARKNAHTWTFTGADPTLYLQGTGPRLLDSAQWIPQNNLSVVMDSNVAIRAFSPRRAAAAQRRTMQASRTLTLYYGMDYSLSGQGGTIDSMYSSTPGTLARISLPAVRADSQVYLRDMAFGSFAQYCTTGCINGGNDSNIVWDTLKIASIIPDSIYTTGLVSCTLAVIHGRTAGGFVTVDGVPVILVSQTASQWIFTVPAHAAGTVNVVAQSGLGFDPGDDTVSLTYLPFPPVFVTLKHPAGWIGYVDTIIGSGFYAPGFTATLGGTAVTINRQTADTIIWTVPTKARGTYDFIGTNIYALCDTVAFRVLVPGIGTTVP